VQTDTATGGQDVRQKAEQTASTIAEQAEQTATTQISTQKERAASTLDTVAQTLRDSGQNLRQEQPQIATLTDEAARRVEDVSDYVRQHDLRDLVSEAERFARREPLLFLGGAFAIGFVAARFLKASSPTGNGNQRAGLGAGRDTGRGGYSWSPQTGFGSAPADAASAQATGGYSAGATGYAGAPAGYASPTGDYTGGSDYAAPAGTELAGTTGEFGDQTDYGARDTALGDVPAGDDYSADETGNR
jgi:ElaB/YqjD/DUF883 family membrane-anchored ribosome-binding protein